MGLAPCPRRDGEPACSQHNDSEAIEKAETSNSGEPDVIEIHTNGRYPRVQIPSTFERANGKVPLNLGRRDA